MLGCDPPDNQSLATISGKGQLDDREGDGGCGGNGEESCDNIVGCGRRCGMADVWV